MLDYNDVLAINRRTYSKIFTGSNQEHGYENIYLSFSAATKQLLFEPSKITFFHYSNFAPKITIHDADLIAEGSTPGSSPVRADKIFKKQANYAQYTGWGNAQDSQRGTWLCAWLAFPYPNFSKPVWLDRFYNPGYITLQDALTAVNEVYVASTRVLYDKVSDLTFDPGVLYMYHHFGDTENQTIVDSLNGDFLRLNIPTWTEDQSEYENGGMLVLKDSSLVTTDVVKREYINEVASSYLQLSSDSDITFRVPYSDTYNTPDQFSVTCWVKSSDWAHVKGNQIFGNYFRGGWGLGVETIDFTPLMGIFEITNGHLLMGNKTGVFYQDKLITSPVSSEFVTLSGIAVTNDLHYWLITNGTTKMLYKLDYNGDILNTVSFPSSANLTDFAVDSSNNIYVLDDSSHSVFVYNPDTVTLTTQLTAPSGYTLIDFDSNGTLITRPGLFITIDTLDSVWTVEHPNPSLWRLKKDNTVFFDELSACAVECRALSIDASGYLWALANARDWFKIDTSTNTIIQSGQLGFSENLGNRNVGFSKEYVGGQYVDYGWILQEADQVLYKIDPNTVEILQTYELTDKLNFNKYPVIQKENIRFAAPGDFMGTQWAYKYFGGPTQSTANVFFYLTLQTTDPDNQIATIKLKYSIDDFTDNEWHMLTLTFDTNTGVISIYNNTVLTATKTAPIGSKLYFKYQNSLIFGGNSGRFATLNDELQTNQLSFNGALAEPMIHNRALTRADITHLYRQKFHAKTMIWNSPVGKQIFIEEVERFFKHQMPGSKSAFYNINIKGLNVTDPALRAQIEDLIRKTAKRVSPVHAELLSVTFE